MNNQTASQYVKSQGFKTLREVSELSKVSERTLYSHWQNRPELFRVIVAGVKARQSGDSINIDGETWIKSE